jgi:hypothetical protein
MIGVIAPASDLDVVREFFELFKTPWEPYRPNRHYEVLVCAEGERCDGTAKLVVFYAGRKTQFDDEGKIATGAQRDNPCILSYQNNRIPVYGSTVTFAERDGCLLKDEHSRQCVAFLDPSVEGARARIGYGLFAEVRTLLAAGQPPANASLPALELHIALLRDIITRCGIPLVEIPPVPLGHRFIVCLTHDVDHPSIREHKWDHTTFGFFYRAILGSLRDLIRGRIPVQGLVANWAAALKLPFVHLGMAKDFWRDFADRYRELEKGLPSTFFIIPFKNRSGETRQGPAPKFRAAGYAAQDFTDTIKELLSAGSEVGLHGIDAWLDSARGEEELEEIRRLTGVSAIGVRMHWLYFDPQSPVTLENAGAAYDSTIGYNGTVGYRAGTTQGYQPLTASRLLELPLHIMDTALFYPDHLGLSVREARVLINRLVRNAAQFGGCLTINWHDRSLAPERLWGSCYRDLVRDLQSQDAWFATAGQAVSWFQMRRSVVFETAESQPDAACAKVTGVHGGHLPGLRLRTHKPQRTGETGGQSRENYVDMAFTESADTRMPREVGR